MNKFKKVMLGALSVLTLGLFVATVEAAGAEPGTYEFDFNAASTNTVADLNGSGVTTTVSGQNFKTGLSVTGTGVVAGGAMRAVLDSVGITDCLAKSKGSSNPHNLVKATIAALSQMRDPKTVAANRGISVEKVFRG
jgi:hypothetical protein